MWHRVVFLLLFVMNCNYAFAWNEEKMANQPGSWISYGRDYQEQRFSPLEQINKENIAGLDLAWDFEFDSARGMEATPLMYDGVLYVSTGWSHVYALDARTGKLLWHYDAQVDKSMLVKTCCGPVNRGVALWQDPKTNELLLYFGALDGRLIALLATNGELKWSTQTTPTDGNYSITGAPRVIKDMVLIGNGGAEFGVRGFVGAYDAASGEQRWRFYTVPGDPNQTQEQSILEQVKDTWKGDYWYQYGGGGGTVWDAIVYDPQLDLVIIGTGNGSPWNRDIRSPGGGDNLFLSSIVALAADSGEYVWHYQVTPKENWDYTATQHLILADLVFDGERRPVIMQAPKNGFFYILDRRDGQLLAADAYTHLTWAKRVDLESGRPIESKFANYQENGGSILWPAPFGAHNWQPMSYSPKTQLVYIPVQNMPGFYQADDKANFGFGQWNTGVDFNQNRDPESWVAAKATYDALVYGELVAWDPLKRERRWSVRHPSVFNGGILTTATGLVFQGTGRGKFAAYDDVNGDELWQFHTDSAILAAPMTYQLDGEQYIAVAQGSGGALMLAIGKFDLRPRINRNRLLVFKLGEFNRSVLNPNSDIVQRVSLTHEAETDVEIIQAGEALYERNCAVCHGISAKGNAVITDLRNMNAESHEKFSAIVFGGLYADRGMAAFHQRMTLEQVDAVHAYLDSRQLLLEEEHEMTWGQKIEYWTVYWGSRLGRKFPTFANFSRDHLLRQEAP